MNKKTIIIYISVALALVIVAFGLTYAYFSANVKNNDQAEETEILSGNLDIEFQTSQWINNTNMMLVNDENKDTEAEKAIFTVKNIGNVKSNYELYLTDIEISDNFKNSRYFKWELVITDGATNQNTTYTGNFSGVNNGRLKLTPSAKTINVGNNIDNCVLKVWLSNDPENNQLDLFNGNFQGRVELVAVAIAG